MNNIKSEGKCFYCKEKYSARTISRHLSSHLKAIEKDAPSKKKSYHIKITSEECYFLHLLINEDLPLGDLDDYFRQIWLECCGHLSSFEVKGNRPIVIDGYDIDMRTKVGRFFSKGLKLIYRYDFGSTTMLEIKVLNEYIVEDSHEIILLSRNEPLAMLCSKCKIKPGQVMCHEWHPNGSMFCDSCKKEHTKECEDFEEIYQVAIVNSPRMGVCTYEGGSIDIDRDGVWSGKN